MFDDSYEVEFNTIVYKTKHGLPFDRGSADSYYGRPRDPHYYPNGTGHEPKISISMMSPEEINAYHAGYDYNERFGDKKSWD